VISRFKIEDIEVQDSSGIVFRATDTETGLPVSIRRFFPNGPAGGGLNSDEQADYGVALSQLGEIGHPALRSIISGGCDPVDGVPYIAAEWIEGDSLDILLDHRSLREPEAAALFQLALEACGTLSEVLGREGVWIETDASAIVIRPEGAPRPFAFWICPLRWLDQSSGQRGLEPLIGLTESIMGWVGQPADSLPDGGMADWLKWLHRAAATASLREAREMLDASTGIKPLAAPAQPARQPTRQVPPNKTPAKNRSKGPVWVLSCTVLLALGLGGWMLVRRNAALLADASRPLEIRRELSTADIPRAVIKPTEADDPMAVAPPVRESSAEEKVVGKVNRGLPARSGAAGKAMEEMDTRRDRIQKRGFYTLDEGQLLLDDKGSEARVEGRLVRVRFSDGGKGPTLFLEFSDPYNDGEPRGYVMRKDLTSNMNEESLKKFVDKTIRIQGEVRKIGKRPEIKIKDSASIEVVP